MIDLLRITIPFALHAVNCSGSPFSVQHAIEMGSLGEIKDILRYTENGLPLQAKDVSRSVDGQLLVSDLQHPFESLPSSYSGLAFKILMVNGWPYVTLKASPAKLLQGHNVFGSVSIKQAAFEFFGILKSLYPALYLDLEVGLAEVSSIDITYSARYQPVSSLTGEETGRALISFLRTLSAGQLKARGVSYEDTTYWGSADSQLGQIKAYLKSQEFLKQLKEFQLLAKRDISTARLNKTNLDKKLQEFTKKLLPLPSSFKKKLSLNQFKSYLHFLRFFKKLHFLRVNATAKTGAARMVEVMQDERLVAWVINLLRLEVSVKKDWLRRHEIPLNLFALVRYQEQLQAQGRCLLQEIWANRTAPLFKACEGQTMKVIDDKSIELEIKRVHVRYPKVKFKCKNFTYFRQSRAFSLVRDNFAKTKWLYPPSVDKSKPSYGYANTLFSFYRDIKEHGYLSVKKVYSDSPSGNRKFNRYVSELGLAGLAKATLQTFGLNSEPSNIVPVLRFVRVDFGSQLPDWYVEPISQYALDSRPQLSLVA